MLLDALFQTWAIFWPALLVGGVLGLGLWLYERWLMRETEPIPPRIVSERAEPVDFAEEIRVSTHRSSRREAA